MSMGLIISLFKTLISRQEHLQSGLIWKVDKAFLEFNEVLNARETLLHKRKRLLNGAIHGKQIAILALGSRATHLILWSVLHIMAALSQLLEMFGYASLAKWQLVSHAIRVENLIMLVAKGYSALAHQVAHRGKHLLISLVVHVVTHK